MRRTTLAAAALLLAVACTSSSGSGAPQGETGAQPRPGGAQRPGSAGATVTLPVYRPGPNAAATARADMKDAQGKSIGTVSLTQTPWGVLVTADLANMPPGTHAFHVHEVGVCEPPFTNAGGHLNPTMRAHGVLSPAGFHGGDMPNITIGADGRGRAETLNMILALDAGGRGVFDADGSSIVVHGGADDYRTDPAGNAGPRIACGVIAR